MKRKAKPLAENNEQQEIDEEKTPVKSKKSKKVDDEELFQSPTTTNNNNKRKRGLAKDMVEEMIENDDEQERIEREKVNNAKSPIQQQKISSKTGGRQLQTNDAIPSQMNATNRKQLTTEELTNLYSKVIQLSAQNKIDQKNSWQLNLIEVLDDVIDVQPKESMDVTNFQAASVTLDASVKIYSHRVDSVYTTTKTLSAGFHNLNEIGADQNKEDEEGEKALIPGRNDGDYDENDQNQQQGEEGAQQQKKKEPRKRQVAVSTLHQAESITLEKFDLAFEVDPLFTKTSAQFDEGGARGLLLNHLSVFNDCDIIFDSNDQIKTNTNQQSLTTLVNLSNVSEKLRDIVNNKMPKARICPTFMNFSFAQVQEVEANDQVDVEDRIPLGVDNDEDIQMGIDGMRSDDEQGIEEERRLEQEIEHGDVVLPDETNVVHQQQQQEGGQQQAQQPGSAKKNNNNNTSVVGEWAPGVLTMENEFRYFDPKSLKNWAGPEHWKFRAAKKVTSNVTDENNANNQGERNADGDLLVDADETTTKKKSRKEPFFIKFTEASNDIDPKLFSPGKASSTISNAKLKKIQQTASNTLPEDVHYNIKMLTQLFNKPNWHVNVSKRKRGFDFPQDTTTTIANEGRMENDDNNKERGDDYFGEEREPNLNLVDDDDYTGIDMGGGYRSDDDTVLQPMNNANGNGNNNNNNNGDFGIDQNNQDAAEVIAPELNGQRFVDEPKRPEQITINYAKTAKFIDVKALKTNLWDKLAKIPVIPGKPSQSQQQQQQEHSENLFEDEEQEEQHEKPKELELKQDSKDFQALLREIPKSTPQEDLPNLSVPFCFICLLHLANEKELRLDNQDDLSKLRIIQATK